MSIPVESTSNVTQDVINPFVFLEQCFCQLPRQPLGEYKSVTGKLSLVLFKTSKVRVLSDQFTAVYKLNMLINRELNLYSHNLSLEGTFEHDCIKTEVFH